MSSYIRWMAVFDNHSIKEDPSAVKAMFKFKEEYWKPHECIHGGDNWEFEAIRKGASPEEKEADLQKDLDHGMRFVKRYNPKYLCLGNHDWRLWLLQHSRDAIVSGFAQIGVRTIEQELRKIGCKVIPYDSRKGILKYASNMNVMHGFYHSVRCAHESAVSYGEGGLVIFGHVHAFSSDRVKSLDERCGQSVACLCNLDMDYEATKTTKLKKENGWIYGVKNVKTNKSQYWLARKIDNQWILPTDCVTI